MRRKNLIFRNDGHALICATEHGMLSGPAGIATLEHMLPNIIAGGVDAVMASFGTITRFAGLLADVGLILRSDGAGTTLGTMDGPGAQFYGVADALRLGVDAMCVTAFPGTGHEQATIKTLARVIRQAHSWDLPVMAEMVPGGFDSPPELRTTNAIALCARIAAELGADWVKIPYVDGFERVIETCFVPVLVLGGPHHPDPARTLNKVRMAIQAGASGAVIGRNIWQAEIPTTMTRSLAQIIHPLLKPSNCEKISHDL